MSMIDMAMKQYGLNPDTAIKQFWIQEPGDPNRYHRGYIDSFGIYADYLTQRDGQTKLWAVRCGSMVLSKSGEFYEDQFLNSSKTDNYYKRFRFASIEDALKAAQKAIKLNDKRRKEWEKMEAVKNELIKGVANE